MHEGACGEAQVLALSGAEEGNFQSQSLKTTGNILHETVAQKVSLQIPPLWNPLTPSW